MIEGLPKVCLMSTNCLGIAIPGMPHFASAKGLWSQKRDGIPLALRAGSPGELQIIFMVNWDIGLM